MKPTPAMPATVPSRHPAHIILAAAIALVLGATGCHARVVPIDKVVAITPTSPPPAQGYSYDHDSRINETP